MLLPARRAASVANRSAIVALAALTVHGALPRRHRPGCATAAIVGDQIADLSRGTGDLARQVAELEPPHRGARGTGRKVIDAPLSRRAPPPRRSPARSRARHAGQATRRNRRALHERNLPAHRSDVSAPRRASRDAAVAPCAATRRSPPASRATALPRRVHRPHARRHDRDRSPTRSMPTASTSICSRSSRCRSARSASTKRCRGCAPRTASCCSRPISSKPPKPAGLMPQIDNLLLFRCVQVMRRLQLKNREVGLFCNIAASTLTDAELFPQFLDFMDANRALASSLVLEFSQSTLRAMGPIENRKPRRRCASAASASPWTTSPICASSRAISASAASASSRCRRRCCSSEAAVGRLRHPRRRPLRPARPLRHRPDRRADRRRGAGGRSARLRRALRPGLPVLAAAPGAGGGAARRRRDRGTP